MKVEFKRGDDNSSNCSRKALGDVTNSLGKRRFSSIPGGSCPKSGDGKFESDIGKRSSVVNEDERGGKRVRVSPRPCSEINSLKGNVIGSISKINSENEEPNLLVSSKEDGVSQSSVPADACVAGISKVAAKTNDPEDLINDDSDIRTVVQVGDDLRENRESGASKIPSIDEDPNMLEVNSGVDATQCTIQVGDELGDNCVAEISIHNSQSDKNYVELGENCDVGEGAAGSENSRSNEGDYGDCHGGGEDFVMSQTGSIDLARLPESQESRCFGLERCTTLKGDGCSDSTAAIDMIKGCTCSFCTKAAYIWTDLHYQDLKGRLGAIKKSEKEASLLVERSCRSMGSEKHGLRNSLESELMGQWRSLFVQMENIFKREGSQLEDSLHPLKDLREKCKADLESLNGPLP